MLSCQSREIINPSRLTMKLKECQFRVRTDLDKKKGAFVKTKQKTQRSTHRIRYVYMKMNSTPGNQYNVNSNRWNAVRNDNDALPCRNKWHANFEGFRHSNVLSGSPFLLVTFGYLLSLALKTSAGLGVLFNVPKGGINT